MRILIIEDDPLLVDLVSIRLKRDGHEVCRAYNGREGLDKINEFSPHIILLDLSMPIMDGFEVLKVLKSDDLLKRIPVVVFSSLGEREENLEKCKKLGANDFIIKSQFSLREISKKMEDVFAGTAAMTKV